VNKIMADIKFIISGRLKKDGEHYYKEFNTLKKAWDFRKKFRIWTLEFEIFDKSFKIGKYNVILASSPMAKGGKILWNTSEIRWNLPSFRIRNMVKKVTIEELNRMAFQKQFEHEKILKEKVAPKMVSEVRLMRKFLRQAKLPSEIKEEFKFFLENKEIYKELFVNPIKIFQLLTNEEKIAYMIGKRDGLKDAIALLLLKKD